MMRCLRVTGLMLNTSINSQELDCSILNGHIAKSLLLVCHYFCKGENVVLHLLCCQVLSFLYRARFLSFR